jgi:hypothetical protein
MMAASMGAVFLADGKAYVRDEAFTVAPKCTHSMDFRNGTVAAGKFPAGRLILHVWEVQGSLEGQSIDWLKGVSRPAIE